MEPIRTSASAWIYFILCILVIFDAFLDARWLMLITVGLTISYILLQFKNIPTPQKLAALALILIGLTAANENNTVPEVLIEGVARSQIFLLLFFAVAWLQLPVNNSASLASVRDVILNLPPGQRFLGLSLGVHILGALLNVAAVGLLSPLLEDRSNEILHRRFSLAIMHGFTSASAWSPFYIGMIVVLVAIPTITWGKIAVQGMIMAIILILGGWLFDRFRYPRTKKLHMENVAVKWCQQGVTDTVLILVSLISFVIITLNLADVSIPVALAVICPPFGLIWHIMQQKDSLHQGKQIIQLTNQVISGFAGLRNEAMMFVAANIFGIGIANIIPTEDVSEVLDLILPSLDVRVAAIIFMFVFCGCIGLHPIIIVVSLSAFLSPELVGLKDWVLALIYLGSWGLSTMVSPYSGTTLFMSRFTGVASHVIGWKWSLYSVLFSAFLMAIFIITLRNTGF